MLNRRFSIARKLHPKTLHLLFIAALLALVLGTAPAKPVQAKPAPLAGAISPGGLLNPDGTLDTTTGFQGTLDLRGWEVTLDSERGPLFKPVSRPAAPPIAWHALPNKGLNDGVRALAVSGGDLYVGGSFGQTGDGTLKNLGQIVRYDTTTGVWHALPNKGLEDTYVIALAVSGDDLYVGGRFYRTGDGTLTDLGNIARYDTSAGTWHALPNQGLDSWVYTLAVSGGDLYMGGWFDQTGDGALTDLGQIVRYDTTTGVWHALPNQGLDGSVGTLAVPGDDLYVGGRFTGTGDGSLTDLGNIARYDTTAGTWHALPNQGLDGSPYGSVRALAMYEGDLYVGGHFDQTGDGSLTDLGHIARCTLDVTTVVNVYLPLVIAK